MVKYNPKLAAQIKREGKLVTDSFKAGQLSMGKNKNKPDRVTPAQLKLIQDSRGVQSPYKVKEAIDPLDPAQGVVDKAMITPNTILVPFTPKQDGSGAPWDTPQGTPEEIEELEREGWSSTDQLKIAHHNPDQPDNILNHILYTPDGEMWGVDLPGEEPRKLKPADRKKIQQEQQKHQQSEQSLLISDRRNLQKGPPPTGGKFGNMINQQAESYRGIDDDKLIELQRIAAPLLIKNV
jgi:hypothetical protein